MSVYTDNGYKNRDHYLEILAEDYGIDFDSLMVVADLLGPTEDFDGLISQLNDYMDEDMFTGGPS